MTLHSPPPHPAPPPQQVASLHLSHLRHRYSESRQQARALKKELRAQRESGRTVLRACQVKLEEQDNLIRKVLNTI